LNFSRAAEETIDPCLRQLLEELSAEEYGHASRLLAMLERVLRG
jgi:rubrerythrin